jgi:hypothetical protein
MMKMLVLHRFDINKMAAGEAIHVNPDSIFILARLDDWTELRGVAGDIVKVVETPEEIEKMLE